MTMTAHLLAQQAFGAGPSGTEMIVWLGCLVALAGLVKLGLGIAVDAKKLREKPAPMQVGPSPLLVKGVEELATTRFVEERVGVVDSASRQRAEMSASRITALEQRLEQRHAENSGRLKEIDVKLDRNYQHFEETVARRDDAADKRMDSLRALILAETKGVHERVNEIVQGFGELRGEMRHVAKAADDSSKAAHVAAEAARGAIQAAHEANRPHAVAPVPAPVPAPVIRA